MYLEDVRVYNLAGTTLAYQLAMAAHIVMAVKQGYSMQYALAAIDMAEGARANVQRLCFDAMRQVGAQRNSGSIAQSATHQGRGYKP